MKKLFSRKIFAMLAAVTLVTAALVTSCNNPLEGKVQGEQEDDFIPFDPPAGMGYIRIKVANNARTILPSLPAVSTLAYRILVEDEGDSMAVIYDSDAKNSSKPIPYASLATYPILITPGDYTVTVTAYATLDTTADPIVYNQQVGYDQVEHINVGTGGETVTINLKPSMTTGSGKFSYTITLPSNRSSASGAFSALLTVVGYPGNTPTDITNVNLTSNNTNATSPATLSSGFYLVTIAMSDPGIPSGPNPEPPALQARTLTNILHIYNNITTSYTPTLTDLNSFSYTVTYDGNGGNTLSEDSFGPYAHGSTLSLATNAPSTPTYATVTSPVTIFDGWARDITDATTKWLFSDDNPVPANPTKLIGPMTLYATWKQADVISLSINWTNMEDIVFNQTTTFNQSKYYNATAQTVTLTFAVTGYTLVEWRNESNTVISGSDLTLSNSSNTDYFSRGSHYFTAIVALDDGTPLYTDPPTNSIINPACTFYNVTFTLTVAP